MLNGIVEFELNRLRHAELERRAVMAWFLCEPEPAGTSLLNRLVLRLSDVLIATGRSLKERYDELAASGLAKPTA